MKTFLAMIALVLTCSLSPGLAYSHGDHGHENAEELVELYRLLFQELNKSTHDLPQDPQQLNRVFFTKNPLADNSDAVGTLLQRVLERSEQLAHDHHHDHHHDEHQCGGQCHKPEVPTGYGNALVRFGKKALSYAGNTLFNIGSFFYLEFNALLFQGIKEDGLTLGVYTVVTETVEHAALGVPVPVFCKLLQAGYFVTAGSVKTYCNVATSNLSEDARLLRAKAAFLAVRQELLFKYSGVYTKQASTQDPYLTAYHQGDFKKYIQTLHDDLGFAHEYLSKTKFWMDVYASISDQKPGAFTSILVGSSIQSQIEEIFHAQSTQAKLWRVHRLSRLLEVMTDLIEDSIKIGANEKLKKFKLSPVNYTRFFRVRGQLGSLKKLLRLFKDQLMTVSAADKVEFADIKLKALDNHFKTHILPLLGDAAGITNLDAPSRTVYLFSRRIDDALKAQKELDRTLWSERANCGDLL